MLIPECPLCGSIERHYSFITGAERFEECRDCGLLSHQAERDAGARDAGYGAAEAEREDPEMVGPFFSLLERYLGEGERRLGMVGGASPALVEEARRRGFRPISIDEGAPAGVQDVMVVRNFLETSPAPVALVESLRERLRDGGVIAIVTRQLVKPGVKRQGGELLGRRQRYSFSDVNLQTVLWKAGFGDAFVSHHFSGGNGSPGQGWLEDQALIFGRMRPRRLVPKLSVVVPVYNEAATVRQVLEALLSKEIPGVDLEVIVVESASTDGSRDIVLGYRDRPRITVVLEERPRGKGFAVRTGLRHVTGDVVLIQDADLEYDFLDYEMLVAPVLRGRAPFVLGTRHAGNWKIRRFAQHGLADLMNLAHRLLVNVMNRMYRQSMTDPFTMFKVFRADCLSGLEFECNRFDFDVELVCKLLRKGYSPLEIPVNYQSRSFREGKKVRIFRDPLTWVRAMWKYRSGPVVRLPGRPGAGVATGHAAGSAEANLDGSGGERTPAGAAPPSRR